MSVLDLQGLQTPAIAGDCTCFSLISSNLEA